MAKLSVEIRVKQRYWCPAMVAIGFFAVQLGACPDKIAAWIIKYGMKFEVV